MSSKIIWRMDEEEAQEVINKKKDEERDGKGQEQATECT